MSDGTQINPSTLTGGDKIDTEDMGARGKIQRVKLAIGAIDVDGGDVSSANPLPTQARLSDPSGAAYNASNPLAVNIGGANLNVTASFSTTYSTVNVPSAPLGSNAAFTGPWEDIGNSAQIRAGVYTDASSTANGVQVQFSKDGTTFNGQAYKGTVTGGYPMFLSGVPKGRYMRVVYTNGPVAQTTLVAEVAYLFNPPGNEVAPLGAAITDVDLAAFTRAMVTGHRPDGSWASLAATAAGALTVDGSAVTQPVSAASLPLPAGAAQDATLTGGAAKAIARGGAKGTTAAADVTSAAVDANTQALHTSVTNFPATQPVSIAATVATDVSDRAARLLGHTTVDALPSIAQLPSALAPSGALSANDRYTANEAIADQNGANGVLTFTFANGAPDLIWVQSNGGTSRAVIGSQTPTASLGSYCADGVPTPHTISGSSSIKVYAPSGATVSVWGFRY